MNNTSLFEIFVATVMIHFHFFFRIASDFLKQKEEQLWFTHDDEQFFSLTQLFIASSAQLK